MTEFRVGIVRHVISYLSGTAIVEAPDEKTAARIADKLDIAWLDSDSVDDGPVDYEVTGPHGTVAWREA